MSLFTLFTAGLACIAPFASAYVQPVGDNPKGNAITRPNHGDILPVGQPFTITWQPDTPGNVALLLLKGPATNLKLETVISENTANSGSFVWTPQDNLEGTTTDQGYGIQLIVQDGPNMGQYQYTTQFGISNPKVPAGSGSGSSSSGSTSPPSNNSGSTSPPSDNSGSTSPPSNNSGSTSPPSNNSGSAPPPAYMGSSKDQANPPQYLQSAPSYQSTMTTTSASAATASADACAQKCNSAYDACRVAPDANMAQCASEYASCIGYNPFTASFTSATACSSTAAPSGTAVPSGTAAANGGSPAPYYPTTSHTAGHASPTGVMPIGANGTVPYMGGAGSLKTGAMGVALAAGVAVLAF